jgi:hypothetical protein
MEVSARSVIAIGRAVLEDSGVLGIVAFMLSGVIAYRYYQYGPEMGPVPTVLFLPLVYCLVRIGVLAEMRIEQGRSERNLGSHQP